MLCEEIFSYLWRRPNFAVGFSKSQFFFPFFQIFFFNEADSETTQTISLPKKNIVNSFTLISPNMEQINDYEKGIYGKKFFFRDG